MKKISLLALLLSACAAHPPAAIDPTLPKLGLPTSAPAPSLSPEQIAKAEALRAEGLTLFYSKDPAVKNPRLAYDKFLAAAEIGDPISMDQVAGFHSTGTAGIEKNCAKAIEWFDKSATAGYPMAMNNLAYTLVTCPDPQLRDPERADNLVKFLFQNSEGFLAWLDTYAAVLAAQGNFSQAAKTLDVVIDLAGYTGGNPERIDEMKATRRLYSQKKLLPESNSATPKTPRIKTRSKQ